MKALWNQYGPPKAANGAGLRRFSGFGRSLRRRSGAQFLEPIVVAINGVRVRGDDGRCQRTCRIPPQLQRTTQRGDLLANAVTQLYAVIGHVSMRRLSRGRLQ
jgi:hypothetical protein